MPPSRILSGVVGVAASAVTKETCNRRNGRRQGGVHQVKRVLRRRMVDRSPDAQTSHRTSKSRTCLIAAVSAPVAGGGQFPCGGACGGRRRYGCLCRMPSRRTQSPRHMNTDRTGRFCGGRPVQVTLSRIVPSCDGGQMMCLDVTDVSACVGGSICVTDRVFDGAFNSSMKRQ